MLYLLVLLVVGSSCGALAGWLMRGIIHSPRTDLLTGAIGALLVASLARWAEWPGLDRPVLALALWSAGALWLTFLARVAAQSRQPGEWTRADARAGGVASGDLPPARPIESPGPARSASRAHPLLVLHEAHALRCWPTGAAAGTRVEGAAERLGWTVEIDGGMEFDGPAADAASTRHEMTASVRRWYDGVQATAATRVPTARAER